MYFFGNYVHILCSFIKTTCSFMELHVFLEKLHVLSLKIHSFEWMICRIMHSRDLWLPYPLHLLRLETHCKYFDVVPKYASCYRIDPMFESVTHYLRPIIQTTSAQCNWELNNILWQCYWELNTSTEAFF